MILFILTLFATCIIPILGIIISIKAGNTPSDYEEILLLSSALSILISTSYLIYLALLRKVVRMSRLILWLTFKLSSKLTQLVSIFLTALSGLIITLSAHFLFIYVGFYHPGLMLLVGGVCVLASFYTIAAIFKGFKTSNIQMRGMLLLKNEQPEAWNFITSICQEVKVTPPDNIMVGVDPNFFVTEVKIELDHQVLKGRTLYMSLPLMRILSTNEIRSIIGHELGHFSGFDTFFSKRFYPVFAGMQNSLSVLSPNEDSPFTSIVLFPSFLVSHYFIDSFSKATREIGRKRELKADSFSAKFFTAQSMSSALIKTHAFVKIWPFVEEQMIKELSSRKKLLNASHYFYELIKSKEKEELSDGLHDYKISHPTDTHPPLKERLQNLNSVYNFRRLVSDSLELSEEKSVSFIYDLERIEEELTKENNDFLLHVSHAYSNLQKHLEHKQTGDCDNKKLKLIFYLLLRRAMILSMTMDGVIDDDEKSMIMLIYKKLTGRELSTLELISDLDSIKDWSKTFSEDLLVISDLGEEWRAIFLKSIAFVIVSDSHIHQKEYDFILAVAKTLKFEKIDVLKIIQEVKEKADIAS